MFSYNVANKSSYRMRVMNHNWSARKQRLHPQSSRDKPPFSFVRGQDSTMWDIVWVSPQGHGSMSASRHFLLLAPQCPSVRKRFSVAKGGQNPVSGLWGRTLGGNWPPEPISSYASIDFWCQLVASPATAAFWMCFRIGGLIVRDPRGPNLRGVDMGWYTFLMLLFS